MYAALGYLGANAPALAAVISAAVIISIVFVAFFCTCCKGGKVPEHKAKVVKNVVEEDDIKTGTLKQAGSKKGEAPQKPGNRVGTGRWDDLAEVEEVPDVPVKFRQKKDSYKPPNPPDVILHPSMIFTLQSQANGSIRPRSTLVRGTAANPSEHQRHNETDADLGAASAVTRGGIKNGSQRPVSEFPLRVFPLHQNPDEQKQNKGAARDLPKSDVIEIPEIGQSEKRRQLRDRIKSSGTPSKQPPHYQLRRITPSDPGTSEGLPYYADGKSKGDGKTGMQRPIPGTSGGERHAEGQWAQDDEAESKPPIPVRRYLLYKQESEPNMLEQCGTPPWNNDNPRVSVDQSTQTTLKHGLSDKQLHNLPGFRAQASSGQQSGGPPIPASQSSPAMRLDGQEKSPGGDPRKVREIPAERPTQTATNDTVFRHGADNMAYVRDSSPSRVPAHAEARKYENIQIHSDIQKIYQPPLNEPRQRTQEIGDPIAYVMDERQLRHQRHPRIDDIVYAGQQRPGYDRPIIPGVYLRPKPYYHQRGMQDATKRFSDASDYSDFLYGDRNPYFAERVSRDFDPYFFRSRWSITPDAKSPEDLYRRRNSDLIRNDSSSPMSREGNRQLHQLEEAPTAQLQSQDQREQQQRPAADSESDIVREYPKLRSHGARSRVSSGYQSMSSKGDKSPEMYKRTTEENSHLDSFYPASDSPRRQGSHMSSRNRPSRDSNRENRGVINRRFHDTTRNEELYLSREVPLREVSSLANEGKSSRHELSLSELNPTGNLMLNQQHPSSMSHDGSPIHHKMTRVTESQDGIHSLYDNHRSPHRSLMQREQGIARRQTPREAISPPYHTDHQVKLSSYDSMKNREENSTRVSSMRNRRQEFHDRSSPLRNEVRPRDDSRREKHQRTHELTEPTRRHEEHRALDSRTDRNVPHGENPMSHRLDQSQEHSQRPQNSAVHRDTPTINEPPKSHKKLAESKSNEYGSLIDVMYRYQREVRNSRKVPADTPENIEIEREKLRNKLMEELVPQHNNRQSKNLNMVVETLLYLCENDTNSAMKRSWHRDQHHRESKSRPSSEIYLKHEDEKPANQKATASDDSRLSLDHDSHVIYASLESQLPSDHSTRVEMTSSHLPVGLDVRQQEKHNGKQNSVEKSPAPKIPERSFKTRRRQHDYQEISVPRSAPPQSAQTEFPFPTEEELAKALAEDTSVPPEPPPRRKKRAAHEGTPPTKPEKKTPEKDLLAPHVDGAQNGDTTEDLYSNLAKRKRSSLPELHFSESEMQWLAQTSDKSDVPQIPRSAGYNRVPDTNPNRSETASEQRTQFTFTSSSNNCDITTPGAVPHVKDDFDTDDEIIRLHDVIIDETMDAEDVINSVEKAMSPGNRNNQTKSAGATPNSTPTHHPKTIKNHTKRSLLSDSDIGTMGSTASSGLPPTPPPRRRLERSEGVYPSREGSPGYSPTNAPKYEFHTPPRRGSRRGSSQNSPVVQPRRESLSPVRNYPVFNTPPETPHRLSPLVSNQSTPTAGTHRLHATSASPLSTPRMSPHPTTPQTPQRSKEPFRGGNQVARTPPLTPHKNVEPFKSARQQAKSPSPHKYISASTPTSPAIAPAGALERKGSRFAPKLPFIGKRFVKSNSEETQDIPDSPSTKNKGVSRTGEIIIIPDDKIYAIPFDCIGGDVTSAGDDVTRSKDDNYHSNLLRGQNRPNLRRASSTVINFGQYHGTRSNDVISTHASPSTRRISVQQSPRIEFNHSESSRFYPIREELIQYDTSSQAGSDYDDYGYAVPVNSPPKSALYQKKYSKSTDNLSEYGSSYI